MNVTTFRKDVQNLLADLRIKDPRMQAAEKAAFLKMAHHIDLPDAEDSGSVTITSGTPNYDLELGSGKDIDRITGAVFVGSSVKQPLTDWNSRTYLHAYRGLATTGTPYAFSYYNNQLWLYYIPNLSGTVYFNCQHVVTDLTDFPDNYYPLMVELIQTFIYKRGTSEWWSAYRAGKDLMKSFKDRMHPKKVVIELSGHRARRVKALNELI